MLPPAPRRPSFGRSAKNLSPRTAAASSPHVAVGARVEASWHGTFYGAQIQALVSGAKFAHVLFDDGMESTVAVGDIRPARIAEGAGVELRLGHTQEWVAGKVRTLRTDSTPDCPPILPCSAIAPRYYTAVFGRYSAYCAFQCVSGTGLSRAVLAVA
eukprot:COSAG06_NODE_1164_length_10454_cov_5.699179_2_plen_157_part_00